MIRQTNLPVDTSELIHSYFVTGAVDVFIWRGERVKYVYKGRRRKDV